MAKKAAAPKVEPPFSIFILEEKRGKKWIPCYPDNGDGVIGSTTDEDDNSEDCLPYLRECYEKDLGLPIRIAEYFRK